MMVVERKGGSNTGDITETFSSITFFGIASSLRDLAM